MPGIVAGYDHRSHADGRQLRDAGAARREERPRFTARIYEGSSRASIGPRAAAFGMLLVALVVVHRLCGPAPFRRQPRQRRSDRHDAMKRPPLLCGSSTSRRSTSFSSRRCSSSRFSPSMRSSAPVACLEGSPSTPVLRNRIELGKPGIFRIDWLASIGNSLKWRCRSASAVVFGTVNAWVSSAPSFAARTCSR